MLDETAAAKKIKIKPSALQIELTNQQRELDKIIIAKEEAAGKDSFEEAMKLKERETILTRELDKLKAMAKNKKQPLAGIVTERDVINQISKIIEVPVSQLLLKEKNLISNLELELKKYVIGQENVITDICGLIRQAQLELSHPDRPLASFLFVGESGVGKTELAKTLAKVLYPNQDSLIQLNMSEFSESFSISKILGSPAGYVGYRERNQFTDKLKTNPYCIVLLDEVDKAHKDVLKLLLQMLENGEITDAVGKKISLKHAIIILTTSFGVSEAKKSNIGFGGQNQEISELEKQLKDKLKEFFSPELIGRLDRICLFNTLKENELERIAALEMDDLNARLQQYKTVIKADSEIFSWMLSNHEKISARELRRKLRTEVEGVIARIIMEGRLKSQHKIFIENNYFF